MELCKNINILGVHDYIKLLNCIFLKDGLTKNHILVLDNVLKKASDIQGYGNRLWDYGKTSVFFRAASTWNNMKKVLPFYMISQSKCKVEKSLINYFLATYDL